MNCQAQAVSTFALENIVTFYINKLGKLIRLAVLHCEHNGLTLTVVVEDRRIIDFDVFEFFSKKNTP